MAHADNTQDIIDSRNIKERIAEMIAERDAAEDVAELREWWRDNMVAFSLLMSLDTDTGGTFPEGEQYDK